MPETTPPVIFHEEQRFQQWWVWLLVYGVAALQWWGFIQQIVLGQPWGNRPAPDWMMWLFWLFFGIGLPALFHYIKLTVDVTPEQIVIHYRPLTRQTIALTEVVQVEARTYQPLREFGGYGIRGVARTRAYNISGNQGVSLTLRHGQSVLLGSQRAAELALAIDSVRPH